MGRSLIPLALCGVLLAVIGASVAPAEDVRLAEPPEEQVASDESASEPEDEEGLVRSVAFDRSLLQPPAAVEPLTPTRSSRTSRASRGSTYARLARAPNMFGDSQLPGRTLRIVSYSELTSTANFTSSAVGARKIGDNEKILPMDRVFGGYSEFRGAAAPLGSGFGPTPSARFGRATLGFEKTFLDGAWSAEARLAAASSPEMAQDRLAFDGGVPSSLTFYLKNLAYAGETVAVGAGFGLGVPATSDVIVTTPDDVLAYREETWRLMPYVGFLATPSDDWIFQGFVQLDFAAGSDRLSALRPGGAETDLGGVAAQHLAYLDVSLGRWLYRDFDAPLLTGVAAVVELHYYATLNDADSLAATGPSGPYGPSSVYQLGGDSQRLDVLNLTAGFQFELGARANLRVAGVAPLRPAPDRLYDGELQITFNRLF